MVLLVCFMLIQKATYNDLVIFYNKFASPKEIYLFIPGRSSDSPLKLNTIEFVDEFFGGVNALMFKFILKLLDLTLVLIGRKIRRN